MKMNIEDVNYVAKLAKLSFTEAEAEQIAQEFDDILTHFDNINQIDLGSVDVYAFEHEKSVVRQDEVKYFEDKDALFGNVKTGRDTYIQIPKVIE
ncbi:MAG: Asp-tRNA(Asn)/Glu-tRNA(Gln) amidotransferase subunit GatC [Bacillota bacterium]